MKTAKKQTRSTRGISPVISTIILTGTLLIILVIASYVSANLLELQVANTEFEQGKTNMLLLDEVIQDVALRPGSGGYVQFNQRSSGIGIYESPEKIKIKIIEKSKETTYNLTIRPDNDGTYQQWNTFGNGNAHWDRTADQNNATGVQVSGSTTARETINLQDTPQTGTIINVTAFMTAKITGETYEAITFDSANSTILNNPALSMSWKHIVGNGDNRIIMVNIGTFDSNKDPTTVTSITCNGQPMTLVATDVYTSNPRVRSYLYVLVNPPIGTVTILVNFLASTVAVGGSASYFNVNPINPIQTYNAAKGSGSSQSIALTPTGNYQKLFYASLMSYQSPQDHTVTEGSGQRSRWKQENVVYKGRGSDKDVTSGSQTMSWSTSRAVSWVAIGAVLVPYNPPEKAVIIWRTNDEDYESTEFIVERAGFTTYTETRAKNPFTQAWRWEDVNALQIGVRATQLGSTETLQVSEFWVTIYYTDEPFEVIYDSGSLTNIVYRGGSRVSGADMDLRGANSLIVDMNMNRTLSYLRVETGEGVNVKLDYNRVRIMDAGTLTINGQETRFVEVTLIRLEYYDSDSIGGSDIINVKIRNAAVNTITREYEGNVTVKVCLENADNCSKLEERDFSSNKIVVTFTEVVVRISMA